MTLNQQRELASCVITLSCRYMKVHQIAFTKANRLKVIESVSKASQALYLSHRDMKEVPDVT